MQGMAKRLPADVNTITVRLAFGGHGAAIAFRQIVD